MIILKARCSFFWSRQEVLKVNLSTVSAESLKTPSCHSAQKRQLLLPKPVLKIKPPLLDPQSDDKSDNRPT
jgi:hypothetical protein